MMLSFTSDLCPPYLAGWVTDVRLLFMESPFSNKVSQ